jgi:hypothetical protein
MYYLEEIQFNMFKIKGIETSFRVPLYLISFHFWVNYLPFWNFLKIPSVYRVNANFNQRLLFGCRKNINFSKNRPHITKI